MDPNDQNPQGPASDDTGQGSAADVGQEPTTGGGQVPAGGVLGDTGQSGPTIPPGSEEQVGDQGSVPSPSSPTVSTPEPAVAEGVAEEELPPPPAAGQSPEDPEQNPGTTT